MSSKTNMTKVNCSKWVLPLSLLTPGRKNCEVEHGKNTSVKGLTCTICGEHGKNTSVKGLTCTICGIYSTRREKANYHVFQKHYRELCQLGGDQIPEEIKQDFYQSMNEKMEISNETIEKEQKKANIRSSTEKVGDKKMKAVSILKKERIHRCKKCRNCLKVNCKTCRACKDMQKNGGPGTMKKACLERPKCLRIGITPEMNNNVKNSIKIQDKKVNNNIKNSIKIQKKENNNVKSSIKIPEKKLPEMAIEIDPVYKNVKNSIKIQEKKLPDMAIETDPKARGIEARVEEEIKTATKRIKFSKNTIKNWTAERNTLMEDLHYSGDKFFHPKMCSRMVVEGAMCSRMVVEGAMSAMGSIFQVDGAVSGYNYDNAAHNVVEDVNGGLGECDFPTS